MTKEGYEILLQALREEMNSLEDRMRALKETYIESCAIPIGTRVGVFIPEKYDNSGVPKYTGVVASRRVGYGGAIEYDIFQDKADGSPGLRRRSPYSGETVKRLEEKP